MLKHQQAVIIFPLLSLLLIPVVYFLQWPVWLPVIPLIVLLGLVAWGSATISSGYFLNALCQGKSDNGFNIALTFDDGPNNTHTEKMAGLLSENDINAAFFLIGKNIEQHPGIATQLHQQGHVLGNHSWSHSYSIGFQSKAQMAGEIQQCDAAIKNITGQKPKWYRPPFGVTNPMIAKALQESEHRVIGWSLRSLDTVATDEDKLFNKVISALKPGDILLFHDNAEITYKVVSKLIQYCKRENINIVSPEKLLNEPAYT